MFKEHSMRAYVLAHVRTGEEREVVKYLRRAQGVIRADFTFGRTT